MGIFMTSQTVEKTSAMVLVVAGRTVGKNIFPLLPWPVCVKNLMAFPARDLMSTTLVTKICKNSVMTPAAFKSRHWLNFLLVNLWTFLFSNDSSQ